MIFTKTFNIVALWQNRPEDTRAVADRLLAYADSTSKLLPLDTRWYAQLSPGVFLDLLHRPGELESYVAGMVRRDDEGKAMPSMGFFCPIFGIRDDPQKLKVGPWFSAGVGADFQNDFRLFTDHMLDDQTVPSLVTYQIMRANLLAVARAFEPDWCQAGPVKLTDYLDLAPYVRPPMSLAWMTWFSPSLAALVEPPPRRWCTITERQTDGSLFMATSTETFDCANMMHLEQARAIHRQIDPLNYTVPFCGMKGRSDRVPPFPQL